MTERLVAYRSLRQLDADGTFLAFANTASVLAARWFVDLTNPIITLAAVALAMLSTTLVAEALAGWRARRGGAELIPRDEYYRRILIERAGRPVWEPIRSIGLSAAFATMIMMLALVKIDYWHMVPIGVALAGALGTVAGAYAWTYARSFVRATAADTGSQEAPMPTPFVQVAMRHYAGYAAGLALALVAATLFEDQRAAVTATLIAFFAGKGMSDVLVPPVYYTTSPSSPRTVGQFIGGALIIVAWWGIPFGALVALVTRIIIPEAENDIPFLAITVGITSAGAIVFYVFITVLTRITQGRPAPVS